jgi:hypothetical protein
MRALIDRKIKLEDSLDTVMTLLSCKDIDVNLKTREV